MCTRVVWRSGCSGTIICVYCVGSIGICVVWGVGQVLSKMINIIEGMLEYEIILSDITQTKISKHVRKQQNVLIFFQNNICNIIIVCKTIYSCKPVDIHAYRSQFLLIFFFCWYFQFLLQKCNVAKPIPVSGLTVKNLPLYINLTNRYYTAICDSRKLIFPLH